jgi:hypothetical protein
VQRMGCVVHARPHLARLHPCLHVLHVPLPAHTLVCARSTHPRPRLWWPVLVFDLLMPSFALACAFDSPTPSFAPACAVDSPVPSFDSPMPLFAMACAFDSPCSTHQHPHSRRPVRSTHLCPRSTCQPACLACWHPHPHALRPCPHPH